MKSPARSPKYPKQAIMMNIYNVPIVSVSWRGNNMVNSEDLTVKEFSNPEYVLMLC